MIEKFKKDRYLHSQLRGANMSTFLITVLVVALFLFFMSLGVIFSNKPLKGSCGGLGKVMGKCGKCDCKKNKKAALESK